MGRSMSPTEGFHVIPAQTKETQIRPQEEKAKKEEETRRDESAYCCQQFHVVGALDFSFAFVTKSAGPPGSLVYSFARSEDANETGVGFLCRSPYPV